MLFIIVVLATYIWRGAMAHSNHWTFGVDVGPNNACLIHRVLRCRVYRGACVELPNPTFWQRNLSSLKWDQITQSAGICWFRLRHIDIHQDDQATIKGVTGLTKINNLLCAWWLMPINISTQGCKMTEPGMMNIYCTKIKLRAAVHQAIYLVIFH